MTLITLYKDDFKNLEIWYDMLENLGVDSEVDEITIWGKLYVCS